MCALMQYLICGTSHLHPCDTLCACRSAGASQPLQGNKYYLDKQYLDAADCYTLALEFCPDASEADKSNMAIYFSNRAACQLKLEDFAAVVSDCTQALELKASNYKSMHTRAYMRCEC
jgi:tetratricopeptide (TPR) repeat protein